MKPNRSKKRNKCATILKNKLLFRRLGSSVSSSKLARHIAFHLLKIDPFQPAKRHWRQFSRKKAER